MNNIKNYNTQVAQILKEQQALQQNTIEQALSFCNQQQLNLAQVLVQRNILSAQYVSQVIKMIRTGQGLNETQGNLQKAKTIAETNVRNTSVIAKTIGKYEVISELGRGGMGVVYKVKQPGIDRVLVLKTLLANVSDDPVSVKRFHKEAQMISSLQHSNIIPIYDFGEEKGFPYFVMQFIEGMDFQEFIDKGTCQQDELIQILIQIAHALDYAHKNNIVHRDVKPANIFLDKNNKPYLADFGLAKASDKSSSLTRSGTVIGTPFYLSPEQVRGHRKYIDHRSDIYALGIILYKIICGQFPFIDNQFSRLYKKIQQDMPISPRKVNREVSKELNFICLKTISKKAEDRYQSAASFAKALERYCAGEKQDVDKEHMTLVTKIWWNTNKKFITALMVATISLVLLFSWWQAASYRSSDATKAEQIYYTAYDLINQEKYDAALQKIFSTRLANKDARLIALRARILHKTGSIDKARPLFISALKKSSKNPEVSFIYAQFLYDTANYDKALKYVNYVIKELPTTAKYYRLRANIYEKKQRKKLASRDKIRAKRIEDIAIFGQQKLLQQYCKTNLDKALAIASQLVVSYPHRSTGFRERANILLLKNNWESAIHDLQVVISLDPTPQDYVKLGKLQQQIGNKSEALSYYEKSDAMHKITDAKTLEKVLSLQVNLKKYQLAVATWKRITARTAQNLLQIARAHYYLQNYDKAKKFLEQIETEDKKLQIEVLYYKAITYYESQNTRRAIPLLKSLTKQQDALTQEKYIVLFYLGEWEFKNKRYRSAFKYLQKSRSLNGEHAQTNFLLAECYYTLKKYKKAIKFLGKAIDIEPWVDAYYKKRAFCYMALKQRERANHDFLYSIELNMSNLYVATFVYENMINQKDPFERFILKKMLRGRVFLNYVDEKVDLFVEEKTKLSRYYLQTVTLQNQVENKTDIERAQRLLKTLKTNQQQKIDEIAHEGLRGMFMIQEVRDLVRKAAQKKSLDPVVQKKLRLLNTDIRQKYITNQKAYFGKIISRYYMTENNKTLLSLHSNKEININVLQQIVIDPWENMIARYYAGKILLEIARNMTIKFLQETYKSQSEITKLLITTLSKQNNLNLVNEIPQIIPSQTPMFLQAQLLEVTPVDHKLFDYFLNSSFVKVSLSAASKMWLSGKKQSLSTLLKRSKDKDEFTRAFALNALWKIDQFSTEFQNEFVEKYQGILIKAVEDKTKLVRRIALAKMKNFKKPVFVKKIKEHIEKDETTVRLQAIFSLALQGDIISLLKITANAKEYPALRVAPLIYFEVAKNRSDTPVFEVLKVAKQLITDENEIMRFIMIEYIMRANRGKLVKFFLNDIDRKDADSAWAMANGLLESDIDQSQVLLELAKHKDKLVRTAAYMSLLSCYVSENKLKKLDRLHKHLLKKDAKTRSHAAFGYSYHLYRYYYQTNLFSSNINYFENNRNYLEFLRILEDGFPGSTPQIKRTIRMCAQKAIELAPQNDRCLLESAVIQYLLGNIPSSLTSLRNMKRDNCLQQYWLARIYVKQNKLSLAQQKIEQAIIKQPWNTNFTKLKLQIAQLQKED